MHAVDDLLIGWLILHGRGGLEEDLAGEDVLVACTPFLVFIFS